MRAGLTLVVMMAAACGAGGSDLGDAGGGGGGGSDGGGGGGGNTDGGGPACIPQCTGKSCGSDGCGGGCGVCPTGQLCASDQCAAITGDAIQVDVAAARHAIRPEIYGTSFASKKTLTDLRLPVNRWGGNGTTRYNWQLDVHNTGSDWFFENIVDNGTGTQGTTGYLSTADKFVLDNRSAKADSLLSIPTISWAPKDRVTQGGHSCGYPVSKFPGQQKIDPYDSNCGNGLNGAKQPIGTADPHDTSIPTDPVYEQAWLTHLVATFGKASAGGIRYYALDNEMMLWNSTHQDVHPNAVTYDEVWKKTLDYAPVIKSVDPSAWVLGYVAWGVFDLFQSGADGNSNLADKKAHGNKPLAQWYLEQAAAYEQAHGQRIVDCLDVHYYPQGGEPLENTRSLWDPTYHDPSWIDGWLGEPIQYLPRLARWIATAYPGTGICVTEYNFHLYDQTNPDAALAEADVLGLFGAFGVRMANYWTTPTDDKDNPLPAYYGLKIFRNFDGAGNGFGDVSVGAATTLDKVAVYAATDDQSTKVTLIVINKGAAQQSGNLLLKSFQPGAAAKVFQYQSAAGATLTAKADLPSSGGKFAVTLPPRSMQILVIPKN
jgi:hypothetical protein